MANKGKIGLMGGLALAIGNSIGGATWTLPVIAASQAGPVVVLTTLGLTVPIFLLLPAYISLSTAWPISPGHYYYVTRLLVPENKTLSQIIGWVATWTWSVILGIFVLELMVSAGAAYLNALFPVLNTETYLILLSVISIIVVWFGIRAVGWVETILVTVLLVSLIVVIGGGVMNIQPTNLTPLSITGVTGTLAATALAYGTVTNSLLTIDLSGDIEDPHRTIPKILPISLLINILVIAAASFVAVGVVPSSELTGETLESITSLYFSGYLSIIPAIGAIFAGVSTAIGAVTITSRYISAAAADNILPRFVSDENQFGEPTYVLIAVGIVSVASILLGVSLDDIASSIVLVLITLYGLIAIIGIRIPKQYPEILKHNKLKSSWYLKPRVVRWSSAISFAFIAIVFTTIAIEDFTAFVWYLVAMLIGLVIYSARWIVDRDLLLESVSQVEFTESQTDD